MPGGSTWSGATGATCVGSAPAVLGIVISALPRCRCRHHRPLLSPGARSPVQLRRRRLVLEAVVPVRALARGSWRFVDAGCHGVARGRLGHRRRDWRLRCAVGPPGTLPGERLQRLGRLPVARQASRRRQLRFGARARGMLWSRASTRTLWSARRYRAPRSGCAKSNPSPPGCAGACDRFFARAWWPLRIHRRR